MPKLSVIVGSTRPGRIGLPIGQWFADVVRRHAKFEPDFVDLAEVNLPFLDEPKHPRLRQYEHDHTKAWSARIAAADAFVFVMPEYNHGPAPVLLNAIDYLVAEWACKPAGFVSYGGISGGIRAQQVVKPILSGLKCVPLPEMVSLHFVAKQLVDDRFQPTAENEKAANTMLDELVRWADALKVLRG